MPVFYADASALFKLVREETQSSALRAYVDGAGLVSSELILTEIPRAARRAADKNPGLELGLLLGRAGELIDALALRPVDQALLFAAGALAEPALRALDAIHVATAVDLHSVEAFVTYDERQAAAARLAGLCTVAPGA